MAFWALAWWMDSLFFFFLLYNSHVLVFTFLCLCAAFFLWWIVIWLFYSCFVSSQLKVTVRIKFESNTLRHLENLAQFVKLLDKKVCMISIRYVCFSSTRTCFQARKSFKTRIKNSRWAEFIESQTR